MKSRFTYYICTLFLSISVQHISAQANGNYRSAATGDWNVNGTWERFDGAIWQPAVAPPSSSDGVITIRSPHTVTSNSIISADQVLVEAGASLNNVSTFTIDDGTGEDLVVNGTLTNGAIIQGNGSLIINNDFLFNSTIQGNGSLTVNGNTTWNGGTLDRTFTNQAGRILNIATSTGKTVNAPLTNAGTLNWMEGQILQNVAVGGSFTNNATMTISSNALYQDNNGNGLFINNGTITKTSSGTTTFSNLIFTNSSILNFNAGAVTFTNSGSITNSGTINLTSTILTNSHTFNHNAGSVIQGSGSFVNGGTLNLNINLTFPASIPFSNSATIQGDGNLTVNNDFIINGIIQGNGSFTVNGNTTWNGGTLDRTFTIEATRTMDIATSTGKTLNAPLTNAGTLNWLDGQIVQHVAIGGSFTNNATMTISSNALYQDNNGNGLFINNGTITKTSSGTTTFSNLIFTNPGTMNFNAGAVTFTNSGSITNTGTINMAMVTLTNNHTFNHNAGSIIQGSGSFVNNGILNLNISITFPSSIPFTNTGTVQGDGNLTINNDFIFAGIIQGNGSLTVNGNTTWNGGTLDRAFTIEASRTMDIVTAAGKTLNAPLTNEGTLNWQQGQIVQHVAVGGSFTNNATMTISSNDLYQDNNGNGLFINNGTITKTSSGTTTFSNLIFTNPGTMNFNAGAVTFTNSGSITNTGTINMAMVILTNSHTFNHNAGSVIQGSGSFVNNGILNLNINLTFPASIPFSTIGTVQGDGNLTVNNNFILDGIIQGNGSLTVNGNTTWNGGTLDRTFTNQAGRTMDIATSTGKTLNAPLTNAGTLNWLGGQIVQHVAVGGSFTNNATMTISSNALYQDNNGNGLFINNGTITKTSSGTTTLSNLIFTNPGTMNFNAGAVTFTNSGSITNTGTINLTMATLTNSHTFNHQAGSVIQGSGAFVNNGILNLNINLIFPALIPFSNIGTVQGDGNLTVNNDFILVGVIQGIGSLTVNGNTTWNGGTLDRTFTNQAGRIMDIATSTGKTLNAPLTNEGTLNWLEGQIVQHMAVGGSITNNANMTISSNALYQDNNGNGPFINTGTIIKTSTGITTISNMVFTNSGTVKGVGTLAISNSGSFTNTGIIDPGLSPGILSINDRQLFSASSTLSIEIASDSGPGTGHDQLISNMNPLTINGTLNVALLNNFEPVIGTQYTVLTYPGRTGSFSSEPPCWIVNYTATTTTITYNPTIFDVCADDIILNTTSMQCTGVANYTVTAIGTPSPVLTYTFTGATTGSGSGTGTGSTFNEGITTVTILADNGCSGDTCSFTVTVNDIQSPTLNCPANIIHSTDSGVCAAIVTYAATASDNCAIASITYNPASGSVFPKGTTMVTATATDVNGNTSTCTFQVTVNDTENPTIGCPGNISLSNTPGVCGAVVNYVVTMDDNCTGEVLLQTSGLASGSTFPVGVTTNIFRVTDASGNTTTCSFTVTVNDTELPTIDCPDNISINNASGTCGAVVNYMVAKDDNCSSEILTQTGGLASGSTFPVGVTTNIFLVTDVSGNMSSCSFTVTVNDTQLPTINCPADIIVNEDPNLNGAIVNYTVTTDDNCPGETLTQLTGLSSGSLFPVGTTTNTFEVEDATGNTTTCSFDVTVIEDGGAPIINCPNDITLDATAGECSAVVNGIDPIVSPVDTPYTYTLTGATIGNGSGSASGLSFNVGETTVTYTITGAGIQCNFTVTIQGNPEICNGMDDDCDGLTDDDDPDVTGQSTWYADTDGDGYGDPGSSVEACDQPTGHVDNDEDCDDTDENINPDGQEVCNGLDDDCDGLVDDEDPSISGQSTWYADTDDDGYGDPSSSILSCEMPSGYVDNNNDCNDSDSAIHPAATEICNGLDDDCDGLTDDQDPSVTGQTTWYEDGDDDGYGNPGNSQLSCTQPTGYVLNNTDCNDNNPAIHPGAAEVCNGLDDDCDGQTDEGVLTTWYQDVDGDGFGRLAGAQMACTQPSGYVLNHTDCNDNNPAIHPGAAEVCNGVDDDCDGITDEGCNPHGVIIVSVEDTTMVTESSGVVYVNVYLTAPSTQVVKVSYKTMNGTAKKVTDYTATSGILRFLPGQTLRTIRVLITVDATPEPDEYFKMVLFDPVNASMDQDTGIIIITETAFESRQAGNDFQVLSRSSVQQMATVPLVPNPQSKYMSLQILGMTGVQFDLMLHDLNGNMIIDQKAYDNDWYMHGLSTGLYVYRIVYRDEKDAQVIKTGKLVIVD